MASVRYYLRSAKTDPSLIMGRLYFNSQEFVFSTGYSVSPKNWNQKAQRVSAKERDNDNINSFLAEKSAEMLSVHDELKRAGNLTKTAIQQRLENREPEKITLYRHIENCIKTRENLNKLDRSGIDRTLGKYRNTFKQLKEFAIVHYKRDIDFSDIDLPFHNKFVKWLREIPLAESTIDGYIKKLKRFLNVATLEGVNTKLSYKSKEFKINHKKKKHIYLTEDEINNLYCLELSGYLEKTRDIFIIGCRTGLRVSDYNKCVGGAVESTGLICIDETEKTGEPVYIPIHWQVKEILKKHKGIPPLISDQKLNKYLKELGELAGITNMVKDTRIGCQKPSGSGEQCKKYELITTHTARRSCATNLYLAGFDLYFISGVLGHTDIHTTIKYLGVTRKLVALRLIDNPYFTK